MSEFQGSGWPDIYIVGKDPSGICSPFGTTSSRANASSVSACDVLGQKQWVDEVPQLLEENHIFAVKKSWRQ